MDVAPNVPIDNQLEVESVLPTDVDAFQSDEPTAEMAETSDDILIGGGDINPDFTDRPGIADAMEAAGPHGSADEDLASSGDVYTPPMDPVIATDAHGAAHILGGFEIDSADDVPVERSAMDAVPGDEALADAVRRELAEDSATADLNIVVAVRNGVAHLRGQVEDLDDADNAESVAARVPGIREVVEELDVASV
jgi:BON domain